MAAAPAEGAAAVVAAPPGVNGLAATLRVDLPGTNAAADAFNPVDLAGAAEVAAVVVDAVEEGEAAVALFAVVAVPLLFGVEVVGAGDCVATAPVFGDEDMTTDDSDCRCSNSSNGSGSSNPAKKRRSDGDGEEKRSDDCYSLSFCRTTRYRTPVRLTDE